MANLHRKPGEWRLEEQRNIAKAPKGTNNPNSGPMLSDIVTGRGTRRFGSLIDSRGNRYRSAPSGQKDKS